MQQAHFWPHGHYLNKLGSGPLGDATYQLLRLKSLWFQTRRFYHVFPIKAYVKHVTPGQAHFWPKRHNLNKLGRGLLGDATYQILRLYSLWFQTRPLFHGFPIISLCKTCDPKGEPILGSRG